LVDVLHLHWSNCCTILVLKDKNAPSTLPVSHSRLSHTRTRGTLCMVYGSFFSFPLNSFNHLLQNKFPRSSYSCVVARKERSPTSGYRQMGRDEMGRKHAPILDGEDENMGGKKGGRDHTVGLHRSQISRKFKKCCLLFVFRWPSSILCWSSFWSYKTELLQVCRNFEHVGRIEAKSW
jgi:hypothetical protein